MNMNKLKCDICEREFSNIRALTNHRRWHDLPEYKEFQEKFREHCRNRKYSEKTKRKMSLSKIGENNHRWKGGIKYDSNGYILIKKHNCPYANTQGYVFEHRLVMEKYLGRYLRPEEIVHHINGIVDDNRIENLRLFSSNGHHIASHRKGEKILIECVVK